MTWSIMILSRLSGNRGLKEPNLDCPTWPRYILIHSYALCWTYWRQPLVGSIWQPIGICRSFCFRMATPKRLPWIPWPISRISWSGLQTVLPGITFLDQVILHSQVCL
ncbi:uncharacterized protein BDV14DRAFT_168476 [Aspergillus stella-maris]|uniref:uncharacterized protein n=1 Tax=Aspergillus stella-maris TaxID=1810926 RepID=UPI003CCD0FBE